MSNKQLTKRIILLFFGTIALVIFLLPAINNFKVKEQYEQNKKQQNEIMYKKYFNKGVNNEQFIKNK